MDEDLPAAIAARLQEGGSTLAVAESLTGGLLANRFARAPEASRWFMGGVVAYSRQVKHRVLRVAPGKVVTRSSAIEMADGVAALLDADLAVAVTGVGGPDDQDGEPPGTVWIAVHGAGGTEAHRFTFDGEPGQVCEHTCEAAVALVARALGLGAAVTA